MVGDPDPELSRDVVKEGQTLELEGETLWRRPVFEAPRLQSRALKVLDMFRKGNKNLLIPIHTLLSSRAVLVHINLGGFHFAQAHCPQNLACLPLNFHLCCNVWPSFTSPPDSTKYDSLRLFYIKSYVPDLVLCYTIRGHCQCRG